MQAITSPTISQMWRLGKCLWWPSGLLNEYDLGDSTYFGLEYLDDPSYETICSAMLMEHFSSREVYFLLNIVWMRNVIAVGWGIGQFNKLEEILR